MKKRLVMVCLTLLLVSSAAVAQNLSMFKMLSDSAYLTDGKYQVLNRYQKDATLFMDMVADTHPYYVKAERRAEWMAKKPALIKRCKNIDTDEAFADERFLRPDVEIDLEDKDVAWSYIVSKYGASSHHALVDTTGFNPGWLWEISGNGLQQKSYLFGTCHGEGHNFTREELLGISGLDDALNDVKAVLFEGGMNTEISKADSAAIISEVENTMKKLKHPGAEYMMPEGTYYKPLFDTAAHFNEVNKFLYYKMKDPEYWKKNPRYWLTRMRLYMAFRIRRGTPLDVILKQETVKRGIESRYVEERDKIGNSLFSKITDTSVIDTMSMKEQVKSLYSIVHYVINNDSVNSYFQAFANVYLQNDTCMMWKYFNKAGFVAGAESEDDTDHEIKYDRNVKWIPVIKENIAFSPCMVAVGCRHLMGSESLIAMLRREGYTVEPFKKK